MLSLGFLKMHQPRLPCFVYSSLLYMRFPNPDRPQLSENFQTDCLDYR